MPVTWTTSLPKRWAGCGGKRGAGPWVGALRLGARVVLSLEPSPLVLLLSELFPRAWPQLLCHDGTQY